MKKFIPDYNNIKPLGRTAPLDDTLWMAFSGTGAEFYLTGKEAVITMAADSTATIPDNRDNQVRLAIYVEGTRVVDDMLDAPEKSYTITNPKAPEKCVVRVIKLSESAMSTCAISSIETTEEGNICPTEEKPFLLEIIGDSITCGYGVDDEDENHHFSTSTEDVTRSYSYKTVSALDVDYSIVSLSGYGIISGYTDTGAEKILEQRLPLYYEKLGFSYGTYKGEVVADHLWDFTRRTPDAIVINLGTNDDSYCLDYKERQEEYRAAYVSFLKAVRSHNPNAQLVCVLGIMGDRLYPTLKTAVADYTKETGDTNITSMKFDVQLLADGYVADFHPTAVTHDKATERLTAFLKSYLKLA